MTEGIEYTVVRLPGIRYDVGWYDDMNSDSKIMRFYGPYLQDDYVTYMALRNDKILGMLVVRRHPRNHKRLRDAGTLVRPMYRRMGIGKALWRACLSDENPTEIELSMVSDLGATLTKALQRDYPKYNWRTFDHGNRPLRDLRTRRRTRS